MESPSCQVTIDEMHELHLRAKNDPQMLLGPRKCGRYQNLSYIFIVELRDWNNSGIGERQGTKVVNPLWFTWWTLRLSSQHIIYVFTSLYQYGHAVSIFTNPTSTIYFERLHPPPPTLMKAWFKRLIPDHPCWSVPSYPTPFNSVGLPQKL